MGLTIRHPEVAPTALGKMWGNIIALSRRPCRTHVWQDQFRRSPRSQVHLGMPPVLREITFRANQAGTMASIRLFCHPSPTSPQLLVRSSRNANSSPLRKKPKAWKKPSARRSEAKADQAAVASFDRGLDKFSGLKRYEPKP